MTSAKRLRNDRAQRRKTKYEKHRNWFSKQVKWNSFNSLKYQILTLISCYFWCVDSFSLHLCMKRMLYFRSLAFFFSAVLLLFSFNLLVNRPIRAWVEANNREKKRERARKKLNFNRQIENEMEHTAEWWNVLYLT